MNSKRYEPVIVTPNFFRLGTPAYPAYLSLGDVGMIIEGGTNPTFPIIFQQTFAMGFGTGRIKDVAIS